MFIFFISSKIVLDYNIQHKQFEKIVNKHWEVLRKDRVLGAVLPSLPQFIYKQDLTLRDVIAPGSTYCQRMDFLFFSLVVMLVGRCPACRQCICNVKKTDFTSFSTNKNIRLKM